MYPPSHPTLSPAPTSSARSTAVVLIQHGACPVYVFPPAPLFSSADNSYAPIPFGIGVMDQQQRFSAVRGYLSLANMTPAIDRML
ncbi:hypothetical protein HETIRDRAFT_163666 [Heterobasidion irregulare TC 32-1]|uniref:Uncharacterized protein n=1 Tax=Heterobasidion irregulare (strain TC 32-1) TaxID=747525 RepID=W4JVT7_HETIT|nr:uncharacterized protein HETIRDRAFT_163666 [Heterobasidion irregulare TC 32-1]ETW77678.1 hypothetical protein HETIRDRAFT_163666 [Heterobasidion irregulare TC 32-1]